MGRVAKGMKCSVEGCADDAVRSISAKRVTDHSIEPGRGGRVYLCKRHYRAHKKNTGDARRVDRWRWNA
jgi:hypothetical protein